MSEEERDKEVDVDSEEEEESEEEDEVNINAVDVYHRTHLSITLWIWYRKRCVGSTEEGYRWLGSVRRLVVKGFGEVE